MKILIVVALVLLSEFCRGAKLPKSFKKCKQRDEECLTMAFQDAILQLSVTFSEAALASLEPAIAPVMSIGKGTGAVSVVQNYKDVKLYGLSKLKVDKFRFNLDKKLIYIHGVDEQLRHESQYEFNGHILMLPMQGKGSNTLIMENTVCDIEMTFVEVTRKGVKYLHIIGIKLKLDPERIRFNFENLFNGDKNLGDNINKVLNDNWREVYEDVRNGYQNAYGAVIVGIANSFFAKVPISEIFQDL